MPKRLQGVLPIVHTPFQDDDSIDAASLAREIDFAFETGADGLGTGMVSEILRLTSDERIDLTQRIVDLAAGRGTVFAAVGAESIQQALVYAKAAEAAGCDGIMAVPPITTRLPEAALVEYFRALAEGVNLTLIVQDASGYVGQAIPLAVYVQLLDRYGPEKIVFKPEAAPIGPNLSALRDATGGKARIFEGSGGILLVDSYRRGIAGTMPGMELLAGIVELWRALERGDDHAIYRLYYPICAIIALQMQAGLDGFLAIEKHLLVRQGLFKTARCRKPQAWKLDSETAEEVDRLIWHLEWALRNKDLAAERYW